MEADIALIGLGVMGENLILNMENKGYLVAVFNRTTRKVDDFLTGRGKGKRLIGCYSIEEMCQNLKKPRKIFLMVKAGNPVDETISHIIPFLEANDIIIDGGNSNYEDTNRRTKELEKQGFYFIGTGISGGEEGALRGPSLMPGGSSEAWPIMKSILQNISAKSLDNKPCCDWIGDDGAGHFVKMVHNGIEYGDMQLISEAYHLMRDCLNLKNQEISTIFEKWNNEELNSYLTEITSKIFKKMDKKNNDFLIDMILDTAEQKGTGKWTVNAALEIGVPLTLISEAVFSRILSSLKEERVEASKLLKGPSKILTGDKNKILKTIKSAIFAAKIISYTQGFSLMRNASEEFNWNLNLGSIAQIWREGCIIRSKFLDNIKDAFDKNPKLHNLLLDEFFMKTVDKCQDNWRAVTCIAIKHGIPVPSLSSSLAYYDSYRCERLPSNLIQAQRDFFGAHTYERIDCKPNEHFHTKW